MQSQMNRLLTHYELAQELGVSPRHIQRLADNGTIPEIRISKLVRRYCLSAVVAALNSNHPAPDENTHHAYVGA